MGSKREVFNSIAYYVMFGYVTIYPVFVGGFLFIVGPHHLKGHFTKKYFGALYDGLKTDKRIYLQQTTIFLVRRFIIANSIAFFR